MVGIKLITVQCLTRDAVRIAWLLDETLDDLSEATVSVWRSTSSSSGYVRVSQEMSAADVHYFLDSGVNILSLQRDVFWRVQVTQGDSVTQYGSTDARQVAQGADAGGVRLASAAPPLNALEIGRRVALVIDGYVGQRFLHLRRRTSGRRCPECWDALKRQCSRSSCPTCFSVGFAGGYFPPQPINLGALRPKDLQEAMSSIATVEVRDSVFQAHNRVLISKDDVLVSPTSRYAVVSVTFEEFSGFVTRQLVALRELPRTGVEYTIPISWTVNSLTQNQPMGHLQSTSLESYEEGILALGIGPPTVNPATLFPSTLIEEP